MHARRNRFGGRYFYLIVLIKCVVFRIGNGFAPFRFRVFTGTFNSNMRKPAVFCRAMPVFYVRGYCNDVAGVKFSRGFSIFAIPAPSVGTQQNLPAARCCMVNMPVVATFRFKRNVSHKNRFVRLCNINLTLTKSLEQKNELCFYIKVRFSHLWWRRRGSNPRPLACEASALTS